MIQWSGQEFGRSSVPYRNEGGGGGTGVQREIEDLNARSACAGIYCGPGKLKEPRNRSGRMIFNYFRVVWGA